MINVIVNKNGVTVNVTGIGPQGPTGAIGPTGPAGVAGVAGAAGPGVATGGVAGQYLRKSSSTNYATAWSNILLSEVSPNSDLNLGVHNLNANGVTVGLGNASYGATYQGISINAGGNTNQANVNLNDNAGNVAFSFGSAEGPQFYISDGVTYQFMTMDHYGNVSFNCQGQYGPGNFNIYAQSVIVDIESSSGGFSVQGGSYYSLISAGPASGSSGYGAVNLGDWQYNVYGTKIAIDDGAQTITMNAGLGVYANNYLLQASTTGNILSGIFPDAPGLPIADWIFNCYQLQNYGLTCDSSQPGGLMRLDMRGIYPFFQLLYQPPGSNSTNDQQGPFQITATSYGVMPSVLIGWPGGGVDNTGTGNGENLQVYGATYVGGPLRVVGAFRDSSNSAGSNHSFFTSTGSANAWSKPAGNTTLVAGVKAITITGLSSSNLAWVQNVGPAGTLGVTYKAVCTTNTLTITSMLTAGSTQTADTSNLNYFII